MVFLIGALWGVGGGPPGDPLPPPETPRIKILFRTVVRILGSESEKFCVRAHLHMAKNLSTKSRRIVDEVSAKDFSSPAKLFLPKNFAETSSTKNF